MIMSHKVYPTGDLTTVQKKVADIITTYNEGDTVGIMCLLQCKIKEKLKKIVRLCISCIPLQAL